MSAFIDSGHDRGWWILAASRPNCGRLVYTGVTGRFRLGTAISPASILIGFRSILLTLEV
jgi:hypothetical protein